RGIPQIVATDVDASALACAQENFDRLRLNEHIELVPTDMFPAGRADLIVCNPPWLPARPTSRIEHAIYDPEGQMLNAFLRGLPEHLEPGGEAWLIMSDLAELLGLREPNYLVEAINQAGLHVVGTLES